MPAFVMVVAGTTTVMLGIRWLADIKYHLLRLDEIVWELWLPMAAGWIPALIWLSPRLKVLTFKKNAESRRFLFVYITGFTVAGTLGFSQAYLSTASGRLLALNKPDEILQHPAEKYYTLKDFEADRNHRGSYTVFRTSGRYNEYLNIDRYTVSPILNQKDAVIGAHHNCWYGVRFGKEISNRLPEERKEEIAKQFAKECMDQMDGDYDYHNLSYFERVPLGDKDHKYFLKAIETRLGHAVDDNYIVLVPKSGKFEERNGNKLSWSLASFGTGLGLMLLAMLFAVLDEEVYRRQLNGNWTDPEADNSFLRFFIPAGPTMITALIIDTNILVYIVMVLSGTDVMSPTALDLLQWGGVRRAEVVNGEWWRLITCVFVHSGLMHLLLNSIGMIIAAVYAEPVLGRLKFAALYLLSGISGSVASIMWHINTVSVGASGAIFGLYGAIIGLALTNAFPKEKRNALLAFVGTYTAINLAWGLTGGIDNAAHIGGLLCGAALGWLMYRFSGGSLHELPEEGFSATTADTTKVEEKPATESEHNRFMPH